MGFHVCISNPVAFQKSLKEGIYGNVGGAEDSDQTFWGKARDLYAVKPNDLVIFYIKSTQELRGIYKVESMPFIFGDNTFDQVEMYPYRFFFREFEHFPEGVPVFEFYSLVEKGMINSISSFERDITASYRGIRQLNLIEYDHIHKLFRKYNAKTDFRKVEVLDREHDFKKIEAEDFHKDYLHKKSLDIESIKEPIEIKFNRIPSQKNYARYETVLQVYITYNLLHDCNDLRSTFNLDLFSELILEAPVFQSMQYRTDILALYNDQVNNIYHSFMELKRDHNVAIEDLKQLIGYLKSYASARSLSLNSYEGIYISTKFKNEVIDYLSNRESVEGENIVRLISYSVENGKVNFQKLV